VRPPAGEQDRTLKLEYAEFDTRFKRYTYTQAWVDHLVTNLADEEKYTELVGRLPQPADDG